MSFDVAAEAYDRFMGGYSTPLAVVFADWAGIGTARTALDVGCGPGALTAVLADRLGPASVTAIDPSQSFVAAARLRNPGVEIRHGAAESLPFPDDRFDATLAQLVVHFMSDPQTGVGEMTRVTRSGGVVVACVWDFEGGRAPQSPFFAALRQVTGHADDETDRAGASRGQLTDLLTRAGCSDVEEGELTVAQAYERFDDWWDPYTLGVAPAGRQLASLDDWARQRVREAAQSAFPSGPFTVAVTAWAARGHA